MDKLTGIDFGKITLIATPHFANGSELVKIHDLE